MTVDMQRDQVNKFWETYRSQLSEEESAHLPALPEAWSFGDNPAMADELGALTVAGIKTATCGLLWEYEADKETLPQVGELSVILDSVGAPLCLIETLEVRVMPFEAVDAQFAYDEGEGNRSLAHWREEHWRFFSRSCARIGRQPSMDMPVVCERFRMIYPLKRN